VLQRNELYKALVSLDFPRNVLYFYVPGYEAASAIEQRRWRSKSYGRFLTFATEDFQQISSAFLSLSRTGNGCRP
jgi:hypothetical protein